MKTTLYKLYKKLTYGLLVYMLIFMFFYVRKLLLEHGGYRIFNVNLLSIAIAMSSIIVGLGILYLLNKFKKFDSYKEVIIQNEFEIVLKSLLLVGTVVIVSVILYYFY